MGSRYRIPLVNHYPPPTLIKQVYDILFVRWTHSREDPIFYTTRDMMKARTLDLCT